jgi:hypothetical protein
VGKKQKKVAAVQYKKEIPAVNLFIHYQWKINLDI